MAFFQNSFRIAISDRGYTHSKVTLLDGVTGFIHQIEIGGWYLIGRLSDVSQGVGRWVQLQDIAAIAYV
jgi:hypothetical protein